MKIIKYPFEVKGDYRGSLVSVEAETTIPFPIRRIYYIYGTKHDVVRGYHAHRSLKQVLICLSGSCTIVLDDGESRQEVPLSDPAEGLFIGSMIWREMKDFSPGAVLMVIASEHYNEADYIRDYADFKKLSQANASY